MLEWLQTEWLETIGALLAASGLGGAVGALASEALKHVFSTRLEREKARLEFNRMLFERKLEAFAHVDRMYRRLTRPDYESTAHEYESIAAQDRASELETALATFELEHAAFVPQEVADELALVDQELKSRIVVNYGPHVHSPTEFFEEETPRIRKARDLLRQDIERATARANIFSSLDSSWNRAKSKAALLPDSERQELDRDHAD